VETGCLYFLSSPFNFYCLTENDDGLAGGIHVPPLVAQADMKGWRYKLQLFQQGFCGLSGQTLFLDLDVVIVDDLDPLFDYAPQSLSIIH
jgi:hypothetical protein